MLPQKCRSRPLLLLQFFFHIKKLPLFHIDGGTTPVMFPVNIITSYYYVKQSVNISES